MPNAFTYTNGSETKEFRTRKELYDFMVERGEVILEGDDAKLFAAHVGRSKSVNAPAIAAKLAEHGVM